ncbi:unnamed protein product [Acanthoscelides obtectus]|uniref:PiggyBac transposable element-derived protein domain-containing protein n=1 Tax=Acanthoscelides obtectus TaxID=200917 RepID=A0A9P0JSP1_ACAOB|nr:unnamed protein product [Acanthoscelides obtectus]CAK1661064.1 hypothetical protein AOBTE_LOCUS22410 [Acanthoscelides obtectus]
MAGSSKSVRFGDSKFEETIRQWYEELESECSDYEDYKDEDFSPESDHNSDSEMEDQGDNAEQQKSHSNGEEEEEMETTNGTFYFGKNRYKWSAVPANPNLNIRTKKHNLVKVLPGLKGPAKCGDVADPLKIWSYLFTEDMENEIILRTNEKILIFQDKFSNADRTELRELTKEEFRAFLAILYYAAVFKSNDEDFQEMFATDGTGRDIFRSIMSLKRVYVLLACLRFID